MWQAIDMTNSTTWPGPDQHEILEAWFDGEGVWGMWRAQIISGRQLIAQIDSRRRYGFDAKAGWHWAEVQFPEWRP